MRILQFVAGLAADSGGPSRCVPNQCLAIASNGYDVELAFHDGGDPLAPEVQQLQVRGVEVHGYSVRGLLIHLPRLVSDCDVVHINAIWSPASLLVARLALAMHRPLVVSPHGMLEPWAMSRRTWRKRLALLAGFQKTLNSASVILATAEAEATHLRAFGLTQRIAVIPNAVVVPEFDSSVAGTTLDRRILFLSRIHPKKGVVELVRAIAKHRQLLETGGWRLVIAGPDSAEGHWAAVESEACRLGVRPLIDYVGSVDGEEKWKVYRSASLFVLPTYSENFGLVIAEALGCGVPCVTTHGAPWEELLTHNCGWWYPTGQEPLESVLAAALQTSPEILREMGQRGISLVRHQYGIPAIRGDLHDLYDWVLRGGRTPKCFWKD